MVACLTAANATGREIFNWLSWLLFMAAWFFAPLLTMDVLSRERREGTIGLLFLTPLSAGEIVAGKSLVQALRAFVALLAVLPVLTIPVIMGGVRAPDIRFFSLILAGAVLVALSAGLIASAAAKQWLHAALLAAVFSAAFYKGYEGMLSWAMSSFGPAAGEISVMASAVVFVLANQAAARVIRARWQDKPPTSRQLHWVKVWLEPRYWRSALRSSLARQLDRNPIGWLQQYSTFARLEKWILCLLGVIAACSMFDGSHSGDLFWYVNILLLLAVAFAASSSFRRERESGALELILVTPVGADALLRGRMRGLWRQFFPTLCVLTLPWLWVMTMVIEFQQGGISMPIAYCLTLANAFWSVSAVGFYWALRCKTVLGAFVSTVVTVLWIPHFVIGQVLDLPVSYVVEENLRWLFVIHALSGAGALFGTASRLRQRAF
jgi:ABC-type transport system involved in multi-copper enzyme maturation permease subunit